MAGARPTTARRQVKANADPGKPQKFVAEMLGTGFLTLIGCAAVTSTNTLMNATKPHAPLTQADLGIIGLAFAIALAISIYAIGKVSGCHINPAVTIAFWISGRIDAPLAGLYILAQAIGAFLAGLGILVIYGTQAATQTSMGVTTFAPPTAAWQAFLAELIGTFIFMFVITAMAADPRSPTGWAGLIIGLTLGGVIMMMGGVTGASLNPARTFGPELVQTIFKGPSEWGQYWVYLLGPIIGAALGAFAYDFLAEPKRAS